MVEGDIDMENESEKKKCEMCEREYNIHDLHYLEIGGFMEFPRKMVCVECQHKMDVLYK